MKVSVEKIDKEKEEEVVIRCYDLESEWVDCVREAANGQMTVCGYKDAKLYRIYLSEICYFEVVDGNSFIYTDTEIYEAHEKLYEFENKTIGSSLFRCSKSMILNADKIVYIKPSFSGRFEAILSNGERAIVSRQYVSVLKKMFISEEA